MSFLSSIQQVVAGVTNSVSSLSLSPKKFAFGRENSTSSTEDTTTPNVQTHHPRPGGSPNPRLGPKLVPTPGAAGGASPRPKGRGRTFMNNMIHQPPMQQVMVKKERERRPLPVLQCGDRYTYWPEYDPSQNW